MLHGYHRTSPGQHFIRAFTDEIAGFAARGAMGKSMPYKNFGLIHSDPSCGHGVKALSVLLR